MSTTTPTVCLGPRQRSLVTRSALSGPSPRSTCSVRGPAERNPPDSLKHALTHESAAAQTVDYLDNGKIKTKGIVNKTFKLEQFGEALESIKNKSAIKAAIVFD